MQLLTLYGKLHRTLRRLGMIKASVYGVDVKILDFHLAQKHGTPYCKVRYIENGWVCNVPQSCIDIMYVGT